MMPRAPRKRRPIAIIGRGMVRTETTDYLDGFQYIDRELQFFSTSEGYVKASHENENLLVLIKKTACLMI